MFTAGYGLIPYIKQITFVFKRLNKRDAIRKCPNGLHWVQNVLNPLKPNDIYICRTAALTSRCCILYIYSTNIHTEYFKHAA